MCSRCARRRELAERVDRSCGRRAGRTHDQEREPTASPDRRGSAGPAPRRPSGADGRPEHAGPRLDRCLTGARSSRTSGAPRPRRRAPARRARARTPCSAKSGKALVSATVTAVWLASCPPLVKFAKPLAGIQPKRPHEPAEDVAFDFVGDRSVRPSGELRVVERHESIGDHAGAPDGGIEESEVARVVYVQRPPAQEQPRPRRSDRPAGSGWRSRIARGAPGSRLAKPSGRPADRRALPRSSRSRRQAAGEPDRIPAPFGSVPSSGSRPSPVAAEARTAR